MHFFMPTEIFSERDCVAKYAARWTAAGTRALIVTGRSSAKNGSLQDVTDALTKAGKSYTIFDSTEENPSVEMVMQVRDIGLKAGADFVIGIGGGSPMDAAKAIALMMANPESPAELLYQKTEAEALPVVEVPTTCGTGSEATPYAILTLHEKRTKASLPHRIFPRYALVDGKYLMSAGRGLLIHTAVDALGHYVESYVNTNATPYSRMLCEYGMGVWSSVKNVLAVGQPGAEEGDRLMLAATVAGMAISHTGTSLPHGLSYYLTYEKHVPHGQAVGYFLPGYLALAEPEACRKVLELTGFSDLQEFRAFLQGLIGRMEAEDSLIDAAVAGLMANEAKRKNAPFPVTEEVLRRICGMAQ